MTRHWPSECKTRAIAFVLDMELTGLGIARALGREGIPVVGMDCLSLCAWLEVEILQTRDHI